MKKKIASDLRRRFIITFLLASLILVLPTIYVLTRFANQIELSAVKNDQNQFSEAFELYKESIKSFGYDWSSWDMLYEFVKSPQSKHPFLEELANSKTIMANANISYYLILNAARKIVASLQMQEDLTSSEIDFLSKRVLFTQKPNDLLLNFDSRFYYLSVTPISDTTRKKLPSAYTVLISRIDNQVIARLSKIVKLPIKFLSSSNKSVLGIHKTSNTIYSYIPLTSNQQSEKILVELVSKRPLHQLYIKTMISFLIVFFFVTFLVLVALLCQVRQLIINPLSKILMNLKNAKERKQYQPLNVTTGNELEELSSELNEMMQELDKQKKMRLDEEMKNAEMDSLKGVSILMQGLFHELNNPLTLIAGGVKLIEIAPSNANLESQKNAISYIKEGVTRTTHLLAALKAYAGYHYKEEFEKVNLQYFLEQACGKLHGRKSPAEVIQTDVRSHITELIALPTISLDRILEVLLDNAHDAALKSTLQPKFIYVEAFHEDGQLTILVKDSGTGIRNEDKPNIMKPFFKTKKPTEGYGLNLSVARYLCMKYDGDLLYLENEPVTTFKVSLPISHTLEVSDEV